MQHARLTKSIGNSWQTEVQGRCLVVKYRHIVPIGTGTTDGRSTAEASMRAVPVVVMESARKVSRAFLRSTAGVGPLAQRRRNETESYDLLRATAAPRLRCSSARSQTEPLLAVKNALQTGRSPGYTLSWQRPPLLLHPLRPNNAVMLEKAAFFDPLFIPFANPDEKSWLAHVFIQESTAGGQKTIRKTAECFAKAL